jgi:predicted ATPase
MITRIFIDNYRCFTNFEFVPERLNLLLGANGAGKSSFFDLLTALGDLLVGGMDVGRMFPTTSLTRWDERSTQRVELDLDIDQSTYRYALVIQHDRERERSLILSEKLTRAGKTLFAFVDGNVHLHDNDGREGASFPFRGAKSFLAQIEARPETRDLTAWLQSIGQIWAVRLNARSLSGTSHEEQQTLAHDGSNYASWYRHFSQENPERLQALWGALEAAVPGFRSLALLSSGSKGRVRELIARMTACGTEYELDFDELSDGQRVLIVLYTLLEGARPGEGCLLLDEPELHVGLSEIQPWLVELDTRFEDRGQVFIASQNPEVIDYMSASHPVLLERPDGGPTRVRPAVFERETELSPSSQLARGLTDEQ